jgi:mersacidin/lichenicidin family type 2 lantibiotic
MSELSGESIPMKYTIVRTWKDAGYRQSSTSKQQAMLSENPVDARELTDADLETVQGGNSVEGVFDNVNKGGILTEHGLLDSYALPGFAPSMTGQ